MDFPLVVKHLLMLCCFSVKTRVDISSYLHFTFSLLANSTCAANVELSIK